MRLSALNALLPALRTAFENRRTDPNYLRLLGGMAGVYLLAVCHLFLATFGTALPSVTALLIAVAAGVEIGWKPALRDRAARRQHWCLHAGLAAWIVLLPWGLQLAMAVAGRIPLEVMAAPGRLVIFECLVALALIAPAFFMLARWPLTAPKVIKAERPASNQPSPSSQSSPKRKPTSQRGNVETLLILLKPFQALAAAWKRRRARQAAQPLEERLLPIYLRSLAFGLAFSVLLGAPMLGVHITALIAAGISVGIVAYAFWTNHNHALTKHDLVQHEPRPSGSDTESASRLATLWTGVAIALLGALAAVLTRMLHQLAATAGYLVYLQAFALLMGATIGYRFGLRRLRAGSSATGNGSIGLLAAAAFAAMTLAAFPFLVAVSLWVNVYVVQPIFTMLARVGLALCVLLPVGYGWGRVAVREDRKLPSALSLFPFVAGFLLVRWIGFELAGVSTLLAVFSISLAALVALRHFYVVRPFFNWTGAFRTKRDFAANRRTWKQLVCEMNFALPAFAVILAAPFLREQYNPMRTARTLFGTDVFVAKMRGLDSELLPYLDEARPIDCREGESGTYSVWRYRGTQMQIRENGVPKALVSTRTTICPQYTAEVMPAVLPLVLHEKPRRVMLLGLSGGVSLSTALSFPTHRVVCIERDPQLVRLLRKTVWSEAREQPESDSRVKLITIDPAVAVACRGGEYDVIVSTPDQSALLRATPSFTRGFYRRVADRLADGGIFCQRFQQMDYGPAPLRVAAKTMQSVFKHTAAIEIAGGEMALLATNSESGLVREGLVERFQTPHVRTVLGRIGWDWSLPLNLTAYSHGGLREFIEVGSAGINTAANGRFAFGLPQEMMRWGPKHRELAVSLSSYGTRFLESEGIDGNDEVLLRRLAELTGQRKLMTQFPDQWWAYRKSLRKQLKERPRTLINSVRDGGGKRFHPEDKRRMDYFRQLAKATQHPTPDSIRKVVEFTESYDPLLTYFAHHEVAALFQRSEPQDPRAELWHRLHTIYYAHPRDRSVRDVSRALVLLAEHADVVDSAADRWDHLNALLQVLQSRWVTRGLVAPRKAQIVLNDIEESLTGCEKAFAAMDELHASVGVAEAAWQARKRVLQTGLARPLEGYRSNLLQHHRFEREKVKELLRKLEEESQPKPEKPAGRSPSPPRQPSAN